ncbi:hypothetical protein JK359_38150 [Streptomyces actinomycinicus]|uniref:Uncharacterized protein n=1 Tax=Streptomyces actinomycinicus TaxID=1695166 RepID=A0A937JTD6_9ACTN|nr:hypothetical protein [Streptomyces actinomycinicus]MBL1087687.1 hypothetical protein [Streptomyces actinomycinicus]
MATPCTKADRGRRAGDAMTAVVVTGLLTCASLLGTPTPAHADSGPAAAVADHTYETNEAVLDAMAKWAPLNWSESVMGYPRGLDRDASGSVKAVHLADVRKTYAPDQAIRDAMNAAQQYAADERNPEPLRASARKLVDGWPGGTKSSRPDIRANTRDDTVPSGGQTAEQYCGMTNTAPRHPAFGQAAPCVFVGKLDEKHPVRGASHAMAGEGKLTYKVSASVNDEKSVTEGWSAGGKITPKLISKDQADIGAELSFSYSYASTSVTRLQNTLETDVEIEVPADKRGFLEGRANGAYYTGYIVLRDIDGDNQESTMAVPARVYVQAPGTTTPVTWFKRLTPA